jgi:integrase/recombinase XerD
MKLFSLFRRKPVHRFAEVAREFISRVATENNLDPSTTESHENYLNNFLMFLMHKHMYECELKKVTIPLLEDYKYWLRETRKTTTGATHSRNVEFIKRIMRYAIRMQYIESSPVSEVETNRGPAKEVIHLEPLEVVKMIRRAFESDMYNIVTDLYLFQCFTGMSYADLWNWQVIRDGSHQFFTSRRRKTGKAYSTPYTPQAEVILKRYDGNLPKITNQQYNRVLKEIAQLLNIHKTLTTHTARKTFATLKNNQGFSLETIADMMGNTPEIARKHYIKGSRERMKGELDRLRTNQAFPGEFQIGTIM